ncbi:restriction endonuclease subunit S [Maribacter sp. X9]|uniref:restriction endonuclease subunit S n=1 Tax=Maribacter sp. X9 TaxID=3402159 RepID=UPI003AF3DDAE
MHLLQHFKDLTVIPKNAQELKDLILKLAVQGKLTANWRIENPKVQSTSKYLEQLKAEKDTLIKEKKIRKEKPLSKIEKEEFINNLPTKWEMMRLGEIGDWGAGSTPLRSNSLFYDGEINWFKSGELNNGIIDYESKEKITELAIQKSSLRLNKSGDVLIAMYGATIGKTAILNVEGTTNQAVCACTPFSCISSSYLHLLLKALKDTFINQGEGGAQPNISRVKIRNQAFALPPLEEQKEIVKVVDTLFKEVEQLEQLTIELITLKEDFVTSALNQLTTNNSKQEWRFLQDHFKFFFNETTNIKKLRETVLQLAVQGKLTADWREQRSLSRAEMEDASILLKRIQKEKALLIKDKKIKKEKLLPPVTKDEIPYELPEGWVWCRMGDIFLIGSSKRVFKHDYVQEGVPFFRSKEIGQLGRGEEVTTELFISRERYEDFKVKFGVSFPGDVLMACIGGSIGNTWLVDNREFYYKDGNLVQIRAVREIEGDYLLKYLDSTVFYDSALGRVSGSAYNALTIEKIKKSLFPLPSLEEQKTVVQKVNALMGLCDALDQEVQQSQEHSERLMQSCLREVFFIS